MKWYKWTVVFDSKTDDGALHRLIVETPEELVKAGGIDLQDVNVKQTADYCLESLAQSHGATKYEITGPEVIDDQCD